MKKSLLLAALLLPGPLPGATPEWKVRSVNLLCLAGLRTNAAGPLLLAADPVRNRVVLVPTLTSSVTFLDCRKNLVTNVPTGKRVPHYLKREALALDPATGEALFLGHRCLLAASPESPRARLLETGVQFESLAAAPGTGKAFLAGRESPALGIADLEKGTFRLLPWAEETAKPKNRNQTPPPPLRKVVWDPARRRLLAIDGFTAELRVLDPVRGKWISRRKLPLPAGGRWHLAGFHPPSGRLYLVLETDKRKAVLAAEIDTLGGTDRTLPLPGFTEPAGIACRPGKREVYVPYDNHPSIHVADFEENRLREIALPAFGNDASALDPKKGLLYVGSWAHGEVDLVDLEKGVLLQRVQGMGILPHMAAMVWNPASRRLYFCPGATAVNGSFGAALVALDPETGKARTIRTGWAPVDAAPLPAWKGALVFGSQDQAALVTRRGDVKPLALPPAVRFPITVLPSPPGWIYLSYGPHQSYWPNVYIWAARDGVLGIRRKDLSFYDRRIPRQALGGALDEKGVLYLLQNNWGREKAFLSVLPDPVRLWEARRRIVPGFQVTRETTQRSLIYDAATRCLFLLRSGEKDQDPGILTRVDLPSGKAAWSVPVGRTPAGLALGGKEVFVTAFDSDTLTAVDKARGDTRTLTLPGKPLGPLMAGGALWVTAHRGRILYRIDPGTFRVRAHPIPGPGLPEDPARVGGEIWLACHGPETFRLLAFHPEKGRFQTLHAFAYPFGETSLDTGNASFFVRGRFGDGVPRLTRIRPDGPRRAWVTDFLSGRVLFLERIKGG